MTLYGKLNGSIECRVVGVNLTLNGAKITESEGCTLSFTGVGNILTLEGKNKAKSGNGNPGVRVEGNTALTIQGEGSLTAIGGSCGAGIGGGDCGYGGIITIESGTITAQGGYNSAGPLHTDQPFFMAASADGLSKDGYTFTCWNIKENLRGRTYFPGDTIVFPEAETELTLYAQWDKAD